MPNFTPNFDLPYPSALDEPCDFAEQWCDFTSALNSVLDGFQATVNRTIPTIPMAALRFSTQGSGTTQEGTVVNYDIVVANTAAWLDQDANPGFISPNIAAVLSVEHSVTIHPDGGVDAVEAFIRDLSSGVPVIVDVVSEFDTSVAPSLTGINLQRQVVHPGNSILGVTGFYTTVGWNLSFALRLEQTHFAIYWHSDGGTL